MTATTATQTGTFDPSCEFVGPAYEITVHPTPNGCLLHHEATNLWFDTDGCWVPWKLVKGHSGWVGREEAIRKAIATL